MAVELLEPMFLVLEVLVYLSGAMMLFNTYRRVKAAQLRNAGFAFLCFAVGALVVLATEAFYLTMGTYAPGWWHSFDSFYLLGAMVLFTVFD